MSDYMYLLESLVTREQNQLLTEVQNAAAELGVALYLTGGAMRDMLGGFPIRDLDFTFEGQTPAKLVKLVAQNLPDLEVSEDAVRKTVEMRMGPGVSGSLRMARTEKVSKPGGVPKVTPAHLLEDLARRDFTVNAIAISLAKASRGLIRDPMNGVSDLQSRLIRVCYSNAFFEEPIRLLRAVRLRHRLGFQIEERTQRYFATGVEEQWLKTLTPADWHDELRLICDEGTCAEILGDLETQGLLPVPAGLLKLEALARFAKLRATIPGRSSHWPVFLHVITEGLKPKERTELINAFGLSTTELDAAKKMRPAVNKLGEAMRSPSLRRPSQVYNTLAAASTGELLFLMYDSDQRLIHDRIRNYLEKYLPTASEITDEQVEATGAKLGTPQFQRARNALIAARLNAPPPPPEPPPGSPPLLPTAGGPQTRVAR